MTVLARTSRAERQAGAFVLLSLLGVFVALWIAARGQVPWQSRPELRIVLPDARGLGPGGAVRMRGIVVGRVEHTRLGAGDEVEVEFSVDPEVFGRIHEDAHVEVDALPAVGAMLGASSLVLDPGSADAPPIAPGALLPVTDTGGLAGLLEGAGDDPAVADLRAIVHNLRVLTDEAARPDGPVRASLAHVAELLALLRDERHTVGKLLRDEGATYARIDALLSRLERAAGRVDPMLGQGQRTLTKVEGTLGQADVVLGAAGQTMQAADKVMGEASTAMRNLDRAVGDFARTTRSLGKLVADMNTVVEELDATVRATQKIFLIRRHVKKDKAARE